MSINGGIDATVILDVSKSKVHKTTVASVIAIGGWTIDDMLFVKADMTIFFYTNAGWSNP